TEKRRKCNLGSEPKILDPGGGLRQVRTKDRHDERRIGDLAITRRLFFGHYLEHETIVHPNFDQLEQAAVAVADKVTPTVKLGEFANLFDRKTRADVQMNGPELSVRFRSDELGFVPFGRRFNVEVLFIGHTFA